jgi:hypothetical protein
MFAACSAFALSSALVLTASPLPPGTLLTYEGSLAPRREDGSASRKTFRLHWASLDLSDGQVTLGWLVDEDGRSGWSWLNRFGRAILPEMSAATGAVKSGPALCYVRSDGRYVVDLPWPVVPLPERELRPGTTWSQSSLEYRVLAPAMRAGRMCLTVEVRSPYGHQRTLWLDPASHLLVAAVQTVFLGQGQEHRLTLDLTDQQEAPLDERSTLAKALDAWQALKDQIGFKARDLDPQLPDAQVAALRSALPGLVEKATLGQGVARQWMAPLVAAAQADAQGQRQRISAVSALRQAALGRPLGEVKLRDLAGQPLDPAQWGGKVLILHFWEYRDAPLEEPYGQVGYLDYLFRRREASGLVVLGVHVDPQAGEAGPRPASLASARRLKNFMNLSYPVVVDHADLLKQLGDPRPSGAALPLFVVVGRDGKVAEYHAGLYEVQANEGLAELDALVTKLLTRP